MTRFLYMIVATALAACGQGRQNPEIQAGGSKPSAADQSAAPAGAAAAVDEARTGCAKNACEALAWKAEMVDPQSGGKLDVLKGFSNQPLAWGFRVVPAKGTAQRRVLVKMDSFPSELQAATKANTAIIAGAFAKPIAGNVTVRFRDVDRCKAETKSEDCDDIDIALEGADETQSFPFQVALSPQETQLAEAQKQQKAAQTKAITAQCIGGFLGSITGNLGGIAGCAGSAIGSAL